MSEPRITKFNGRRRCNNSEKQKDKLGRACFWERKRSLKWVNGFQRTKNYKSNLNNDGWIEYRDNRDRVKNKRWGKNGKLSEQTERRGGCG